MASTQIMRIEDSERHAYLERLQVRYGKTIAGEQDLVQSRQLFIEDKRHRLNSYFVSNITCLDLFPKRLLISATQKCTFSCSHCWAFASPKAVCSLDLRAFNAIYENMLSSSPPSWTLTGGEFFALPYWSDILRRFPVQCIYSNAFWGHPAEKCQAQIVKIRQALENNPGIDIKRFTMILSYDRYHTESAGKVFPLAAAVAGIIDKLYESVPNVSVRISHTENAADGELFYPVIGELETAGYQINRTQLSEKRTNIRTISFAYSKGKGLIKELSVDMFPSTPICRGLFLLDCKKAQMTAEDTSKLPALDSLHRSNTYHQYSVGPDGGIGLYETLYAPPVPYFLGNLVHEPWVEIEQRIKHDPIAITLRRNGMGPIIGFMEKYEPLLLRSIAADIQNVQQLLYLIFLNPIRRLLLNAFLLNDLRENNLLNCSQEHTTRQISLLLEMEYCLEREKQILDLYRVG